MKGKLLFIFIFFLSFAESSKSGLPSFSATESESIQNDKSDNHLSAERFIVTAATSDLTVTVKNVNSVLRSAAQVKLYDAGNSLLISTQTTNSSGQALFAGLPDGTYNYDVTYKSPVISPIADNTEFWGSGQVTINGSSQSVSFTRNQPYISAEANFAPATLNSGQVSSGSFTVKNTLSTSTDSYAAVWIDRDKTSLWDIAQNSLAKTINAGSTSAFGFSVATTVAGTYYYYAFVYSKVNGIYTITDQYTWTHAFVVGDQELTIESIAIIGTVFGPGSTVHVDVTVKNPGAVAKTGKVDIRIDMDKLPAYNFESLFQGPITIQPGQKSVFGFDWTIPLGTAAGTFYIASGVQTLTNSGYTTTDASNWVYSFQNENTTISQIQWSGYTWTVKGGVALGPGPNDWLANSSSVWVDAQDNLHLKIRKIGTKWYCSSISTKPSLGYGDYTFQVSSDVEKLDKNIVVGLFTYETDTREIDIEFSRWSDPVNPAGWFNVQPSGSSSNHSFPLNLSNVYSTHKFQWKPSEVFFQSYYGHSQYLPEKNQLISEWAYFGSQIPPAGNERIILNFWLFKGVPPSDLKEAEVVIKSFTFKKIGDLTVQLQNLDNTSTPAPGPNGIVKLYNSQNDLISTKQTNQNGAATFAGIPEGSGYYYQVFHNPTNPALILGQEYWGSKTDVNVIAAQTTNSIFKRNQPTSGIVKVYNGTTDVTGQLVEPNTPLRIEQQIINPSLQVQSLKGSVILDLDKNKPYNQFFTESSFSPIPANGTSIRSWIFTPTEIGQYFSSGSVRTMLNNDTLYCDGGTWSATALFGVSPAFDFNLISEIEQKVTQNSTANWLIKLKNTSPANDDFSLNTDKGAFFFQGKQIVKTPVLKPNEEIILELRFNSGIIGIGTTGKIKISVISNKDPNRRKEIELTYTIIQSALVLKTNNVTSITFTTATSGGTITSDGGTTISAKGICWGTAAYPTVFLDTKTAGGSGTAAFSGNITGLTAGTTYHVRAYAVNPVSVAYGNDVVFTTVAIKPPVAGFSAVPINGCIPLTVQFTDQSSEDPTSYSWDIDNNGSVDYTSKNPIHTYSKAGTYSVKLTAANISGSGSKILTNYITVNPIVLPEVSISAFPSIISETGKLVTFTAVPANGGTNPKYEWKVDGAIVGNNSSIYATTGLTDGQIVSCQLTSNYPCINSATAISNSITMKVNFPVGSEVISINDLIKVFPNPTTGMITIDGLPENQKSTIEVFSATGKQIIRKITYSTKDEIDIGKQVPGAYLLVINKQSIKIVKK